MSNNGDAKPQMDPDASEPVIEDRELPRMQSVSRIVEAADGEEGAKGPRMDPTNDIGTAKGEEPPSPKGHRDPDFPGREAGKGYMDPHAEAVVRSADARAPRGEQQPLKMEKERPPHADENYVRLRVVGSGGQWRVVGRAVVPGPLAVPDRLRYGWAWEVRYRGERLGLGLVPDMGEIRGFPDPEGRPGMEGHHFATPREMEFVVRIPEDAMRTVEVEELEIDLYRVEDPPTSAVGPQSLGEQFPDQVTRVSGRPR